MRTWSGCCCCCCTVASITLSVYHFHSSAGFNNVYLISPYLMIPLLTTIGILASILASVVPRENSDVYISLYIVIDNIYYGNYEFIECIDCLGWNTGGQKKSPGLYYPCIRRLVMRRGRDTQCQEEREFYEITKDKQETKTPKNTWLQENVYIVTSHYCQIKQGLKEIATYNSCI